MKTDEQVLIESIQKTLIANTPKQPNQAGAIPEGISSDKDSWRHFEDDAFFCAKTQQVLTTDMLVEGVHFSTDYFSPFDIGWKTMAVNLSDIVAMAAMPQYCLVSMALPKTMPEPYTPTGWVTALYNGMQAVCKQFGGKIIGGDTVYNPNGIVLSVTATGITEQAGFSAHRFNARPGDIVLVAGHHGLSAIGLSCFQNKIEGFPESKQAHLTPKPQQAAMRAYLDVCRQHDCLEQMTLTDTSDGLAPALIQLATASHTVLCVDTEQTPIHPEVYAYYEQYPQAEHARKGVSAALNAVLYGGEDFGLVAALPASIWQDKASNAKLAPFFTKIGTCESNPQKGTSVTTIPGAYCKVTGQTLQMADAFQHFQ
ncbi:MAG: thiamine-phosphate kinase [Cyanobacteria bacterium P01_H01_bin.74]